MSHLGRHRPAPPGNLHPLNPPLTPQAHLRPLGPLRERGEKRDGFRPPRAGMMEGGGGEWGAHTRDVCTREVCGLMCAASWVPTRGTPTGESGGPCVCGVWGTHEGCPYGGMGQESVEPRLGFSASSSHCVGLFAMYSLAPFNSRLSRITRS